MNRARNALTGEIRNFHAGGDRFLRMRYEYGSEVFRG
jgi:hypothetical protein